MNGILSCFRMAVSVATINGNEVCSGGAACCNPTVKDSTKSDSISNNFGVVQERALCRCKGAASLSVIQICQ